MSITLAELAATASLRRSITASAVMVAVVVLAVARNSAKASVDVVHEWKRARICFASYCKTGE